MQLAKGDRLVRDRVLPVCNNALGNFIYLTDSPIREVDTIRIKNVIICCFFVT